MNKLVFSHNRQIIPSPFADAPAEATAKEMPVVTIPGVVMVELDASSNAPCLRIQFVNEACALALQHAFPSAHVDGRVAVLHSSDVLSWNYWAGRYGIYSRFSVHMEEAAPQNTHFPGLTPW